MIVAGFLAQTSCLRLDPWPVCWQAPHTMRCTACYSAKVVAVAKVVKGQPLVTPEVPAFQACDMSAGRCITAH